MKQAVKSIESVGTFTNHAEVVAMVVEDQEVSGYRVSAMTQTVIPVRRSIDARIKVDTHQWCTTIVFEVTR